MTDSDLHKIKILLPGHTDSGSVELDGQPLRGVTAIRMECYAPSITKVELTLLADLDFEGDAALINRERDEALDALRDIVGDYAEGWSGTGVAVEAARALLARYGRA